MQLQLGEHGHSGLCHTPHKTWDDHTGAALDAKKVKEGRQPEMEYHDKMHVFDKVLIAQMLGGDRQGALESKMGGHRQRHEISKQMGSRTIQRIRQRKLVCCNSAN